MTQRTSTITRRKLLGGVGATGLVTLGFRGATVTSDTPDYTDYTYARTDDNGPRLRVAWYSTYNGHVVNATPTANETEQPAEDPSTETTVDGYDAATDGPLIAASNVLPGDTGTIALGLFAEAMDARVRLIPTVSGDLSEVVDVALWYDTGLFGIGGCTGTGAIPDDPDVELTLAELGEMYGPGTDGLRLRNGFGDCLAEGDRLCLGFAWTVTESATNEWQGQSLEFELAVGAEQCGGGR
ncbi:hypothetical protein [Natronorubrum thiooxidans]|uniref:SipW-cognate class signal peptide n=1 Tax=Natronorubrum thiooxidans TaxID=308853 RepID=A0A1N7GYZ5_9EURY|nr:hypothetical protein [Natronorubrum thiooxidans]SIS17803.1 hypothetical protein SAMN05421752_11832 [Natronorubrum thiooxidans]